MAAEQTSNHLDIVEKGDLEEITRGRHLRRNPGSVADRRGNMPATANTASTTSSRFQSGIASSLELLTPEEVLGQEEYELELEEYDDSGSDLTESDDDTVTMLDTGRTSSLFGIAEPPGTKSTNQQQMKVESVEDEEYLATRQLVLFEDDPSDVDLESEEERDIIKEIKYEITEKVREEMKEELVAMKQHQQRQSKQNDDKHADLNALDPKLKEAIIKMRKLDKILAKKIKREKEVKRDRILLQKKLKEELSNIKTERKELKEVETNTMKFLALTLPPSHNEGVTLIDEDTGQEMSPPPVTPVFATQIPLDEQDPNHAAGGSRQTSVRQSGSQQSSSGLDDDASSTQSASSLGGSTLSGSSSQASHKRRKKKKKDFIKRNMELAANAGDGVAMTDDEKQRVDDLLKDLDAIPELPEDASVVCEEENPYQITLSCGEGFLPTPEEQRRLLNIDSRLQTLLPADDFQSIVSSQRSTAPSPQSVLFTRTRGPPHTYSVEELGEQALKETKEHRDLQSRLKDIEDQLNHLTSTVELEIESPSLSEEQLNDLLDMCARTISRTTAETDSIAQHTTARSSMSNTSCVSRASLLENPPKLAPDVLQQLLADARQSITPRQADTDTASPDKLESVSEDTIRELLQNSRATSRASVRPLSRQQAPRPAQSAEEPTVSSRTDSESPASERRLFEARDERRPFLPEIDRQGSLITQGHHQGERGGSGGQRGGGRITPGEPVPRPPSGTRSHTHSRASIRTLSSVDSQSLDD